MTLRRTLISLCSIELKNTVEFAGFEISLTSVKPCAKVLQSIKDFPTPRNVTDIRSWFGLVNQVAYAFAVADHMQPFRELLKSDQPFAWTEHFDYLFRKSKVVIIDQIKHGVEIFDQIRPTCIATDWSQKDSGTGYPRNIMTVLMLDHSAACRVGK